MKASGEGAGTKAGLGVEELRADNTQEVLHNDDFENSFDLTCFISRPSWRKKGPMILVRARWRVLLAYEDAGKREADLL